MNVYCLKYFLYIQRAALFMQCYRKKIEKITKSNKIWFLVRSYFLWSSTPSLKLFFQYGAYYSYLVFSLHAVSYTTRYRAFISVVFMHLWKKKLDWLSQLYRQIRRLPLVQPINELIFDLTVLWFADTAG